MILTLLILSVILFCWATFQSGKLADTPADNPEELKPTPTKVEVEFIDNSYNDFDEDPPTVVMQKKKRHDSKTSSGI